MKQLQLTLGVALLILFTIGCATTTTTSQTTNDMLVAAGFKQVTADTPQKQKLLKLIN